ncbi:MAG: ybeY [Ferruginibacter sp.]|nr:ybeY [Ferruginibacter sp.]
MDIAFNFQAPVNLRRRKALREFLAYLASNEDYHIESLSFVFCDDPYLLQINKDYLKHDYFTDIITFDLSASNADEIMGEVYISVDTVRANSQRFNVSLFSELHRVMFHGLLHLCGYKDKTADEKHMMKSKEDFYLDAYFNPCSTWNLAQNNR